MARLGTFRSLKQRNARLFFAGMLVSNCGTWMQATAQGWLVYRLSGQGTSLGLVLACQFLPLLLLGPWAGVLADQVNRRRLTIAAQAGMAAQAILLGVLDLTGVVTLGLVYGLTVVLGVLAAIDNPARRSLVTELVDEEDIPNVLSLNTAVMTGSRVFGPALAAVLVGLVGTGWCFIANGLSFLAVLVSLILMNPVQLRTVTPRPRGGRPLREALRLHLARASAAAHVHRADRRLDLRLQLRGVAAPRVVAQPGRRGHGVRAPLGRDQPRQLRRLADHRLAAPRRHGAPCWPRSPCSVCSPRSWASPRRWPSPSCSPYRWAWAAPATSPSTNGIILPRVPANMRGRVLALQATAFLGSTPIGGPITGWIGDHVGAGWSIAYGGLIALGCVGAVALSLQVRNRSAAGAPAVPAESVP